MKIIEPSVEYWQQGAGMEGVWNQIARATRTCYQSSVREGESSEDFVKRIILKPALIEGNLDDLEHCKFNFDKMHGAMLEHGTVYLTINYNDFTEEDDDANYDFNEVVEFYENNKYSKLTWVNGICYVTTNMRVIIENNKIKDLRAISKNIEHHVKRYTFSVITDIGVTREMNRHRTFSIAEQSTRYCDFNKDKFNNELTSIKPTWIDENNTAYQVAKDETSLKEYCDTFSALGTDCHRYSEDYLVFAYKACEFAYKKLRESGWRPEQARQVLPLGLKTQAVYTAFEDDWKHFLRLRADNISGKVHPNMAVIANMIKDKFNKITNK